MVSRSGVPWQWAVTGCLMLAAAGEAVGVDTYQTRDTLAVVRDRSVDAQAMIEQLTWRPCPFKVTCEPEPRAEYDRLVRFPSPVSTGDDINDRVALEWRMARDADGKLIRAPAVIVVHEVRLSNARGPFVRQEPAAVWNAHFSHPSTRLWQAAPCGPPAKRPAVVALDSSGRGRRAPCAGCHHRFAQRRFFAHQPARDQPGRVRRRHQRQSGRLFRLGVHHAGGRRFVQHDHQRGRKTPPVCAVSSPKPATPAASSKS